MMKTREILYYNDPELTAQDKMIEPIRGNHGKRRMSLASRCPDFDRTRSKQNLGWEPYTTKFYPKRRETKLFSDVVRTYGSKSLTNLPKQKNKRDLENGPEDDVRRDAFHRRGTKSMLSRFVKKRRQLQRRKDVSRLDL